MACRNENKITGLLNSTGFTASGQILFHLCCDKAAQKSKILPQNELLKILQMYEFANVHCFRIRKTIVLDGFVEFDHFALNETTHIQLQWKSDTI